MPLTPAQIAAQNAADYVRLFGNPTAGSTAYNYVNTNNPGLLNHPTTPTAPSGSGYTAPTGGSPSGGGGSPVGSVSMPTIPTIYNSATGATANPTSGTTAEQLQYALSHGWTTTAPGGAGGSPLTGGTGTGAGAGAGAGPVTPGDNSDSALQALLSRYESLQNPTQSERDLSARMASIEAARVAGHTAIEGQPIAYSFMTGQEAAGDKASTAQEQVVSDQLNREQAQRTGSLTAIGNELSYLKPTTVGLGTNLVDPLTGRTIAEGQSYAAKQGTANVLSLSRLYPDAGILPTDDPNVAAQKASQAPSFIAKYGKAQYQWDPNTGQFDLLSTNRLGNTTPGSSYGGNPNGNGGQSNFGTPAGNVSGASGGGSGGAGIGGGSIVDYLNSIGQPSDRASRGALAARLGIQNYTGTAQQNTQLLGMLRSASGNGGPGGAGMMSIAGGGQAPAGGSGGAPGTASGSSPFGLNLGSKIDNAALAYIQTGDMPTGVYPADQAAVRARANAVIPGFNPAVAKANAKAIGEQTSQQADTYRAITAADSNFGLLTQTFQKAGVNDMASPLANQLNNWVQTGLVGNSDVINFKSAVSTLQTEYATVLGRGGEVTDSVRKSAANVISGNYSMNDLISLHTYIDKEGKNVIDSYTQTIRNLATGGIGSGGTGPGSSPTGGQSGTTPSGISYTIH